MPEKHLPDDSKNKHNINDSYSDKTAEDSAFLLPWLCAQAKHLPTWIGCSAFAVVGSRATLDPLPESKPRGNELGLPFTSAWRP